MFVTDSISCTRKPSHWRMLHRRLAVGLLTQQEHSRPTYSASVISLQWSYSFQQSYRTCCICRGTTGWLKKTLKEQSQDTSLHLSNGNIACQIGIIQAKARMVGNHKCFMEVLTGSSIPEWAQEEEWCPGRGFLT